MFVKNDEAGNIISLFVWCAPADLAGYTEIPYDEDLINEFKARSKPQPEPTPEERIAALEEQLAAAKILLGVE